MRNLVSLLSDDSRRLLNENINKDHAVVDVYNVLRPDLTIIDGLFASYMGDPRQADVLLAGIDAVAADTVAAAVLGTKIERSPYLQIASQHGAGVCDTANIAVFGADLRPVIAKFAPNKAKGVQ